MLRSIFIKLTPLVLLEQAEYILLRSYGMSKNLLAHSNPNLLELISERKALAMLYLVEREVPAYQRFLAERKINIGDIYSIGDFNTLLPETTKENYVKKNKIEALFRRGVLPTQGVIEESSGSSGHPTDWIKSIKEDKLLQLEVDFESKYLYNLPKKSIIISCWSPGPWATDLKFCELFEHQGLLKNVGPNIEGVIETLQKYGPSYHYLIAGYPPFCRLLIEKAKDIISWKKYTVDLLVGGEGFVIGWREHVKSILGKNARIFSCYGASDIDIGIAFETPYAIFIRTLLMKNEKMREALNIKGNYPMIFQYNPLAHYISNTTRTNEQNKIVHEFTVTPLDLKVGAPKIKYNLHDEGQKVSFQEMEQLLLQFAKNEKKEFIRKTTSQLLHLPFLLVMGRSDGTISINGTNIYPQQVEIALMKEKKLFSVLHTFRISGKLREKERLIVKIELQAKVKVTEQLRKKISQVLLKYLPTISEEYQQARREFPEVFTPIVELYHHGEGPFVGTHYKVKHKYIE